MVNNNNKKGKVLYYSFIIVLVFITSCVSNKKITRTDFGCDYFKDNVRILNIDSCCSSQIFKVEIKGKNYRGIIISNALNNQVKNKDAKIKVGDRVDLYLKNDCVSDNIKESTYSEYNNDSLIWSYDGNAFTCLNLEGLYIQYAKVNIDSLNRTIKSAEQEYTEQLTEGL